VSGVEELQKIESLASANFSENDAVRPVAKCRFQEIANSHGGDAVLFAAASNRTKFSCAR